MAVAVAVEVALVVAVALAVAAAVAVSVAVAVEEAVAKTKMGRSLGWLRFRLRIAKCLVYWGSTITAKFGVRIYLFSTIFAIRHNHSPIIV